jgi:hypothetical protein
LGRIHEVAIPTKTEGTANGSFPTVTLTDDEQRECQAYLRLVLPGSDKGSWVAPKAVADMARRSLIAVCMLGRANRFATLRRFSEA